MKDLPPKGKLCICSEFLYGMCIAVWSVALNFHLSACGISESQIGVLLCLGYLVTAVVSFFVGRVGDRKGYPFVMGLGALLMGVALFAITWVRILSLFYLFHGIYCTGLACAMAMEFNLPLSLVREEHRQYSYNLVLVFYFLGSIAGNLMCSFCLPALEHWGNPYRCVLMVCAASHLFLAFFRGRMPRVIVQRTETGPVGDSVWTLLGWKNVQGYLLYGFLTFGLFTLSTGMLNLVLRLWHGMSDSKVSTVFLFNSLAGCVVLIVLPKLLRHISLQRISGLAMTAQLAAFAGMAVLPVGPFVAMTFLRTASCNILYTSVDSPMLQSIPAQSRGTYAGMRVFANYIGMSLASVVSGWLVDLRNFHLLYLICASVALAQFLTYQLLCKKYLIKQESSC